MELKETVIKRPLTIGDAVYYVWQETVDKRCPDIFHVTKSTVTDIAVNWGFSISYDSHMIISWSEIGESVFLTLDDAVNSLKLLHDYTGVFTYSEY